MSSGSCQTFHETGESFLNGFFSHSTAWVYGYYLAAHRRVSPPALKSFLFALFTPLSISAQSVTPVATIGEAAPGGGTYSGVEYAVPLTTPDGSVSFRDSAVPDFVVGFPGAFARLNIQESTISGLVLAWFWLRAKV